MLTDVVLDAHAKGYLINVKYATMILLSIVSLNMTFSLFYLLMDCGDMVPAYLYVLQCDSTRCFNC